MGYNNPQVADFKSQFTRDFKYNTDPTAGVTDGDIANAFVSVNANFNPGLFSDQGTYSYYYLLLAAHYLVLNIRASSGGLSGGGAGLLEQSKSVGSISQSFAIPQRYLDNPLLSMLASTQYGSLYLQWLLPQLTGQMFSVCGTTQP